MTKQDAYRIVLNDILNSDIGLFVGRFDAENGSCEFMGGIEAVMEYIAEQVSKADYYDFEAIWWKNFEESVDKARKKWYT